jgi:hypothetical protein
MQAAENIIFNLGHWKMHVLAIVFLGIYLKKQSVTVQYIYEEICLHE